MGFYMVCKMTEGFNFRQSRYSTVRTDVVISGMEHCNRTPRQTPNKEKKANISPTTLDVTKLKLW
jgi:hypothetical protein